jgi:homoserine O-acetyltransferase/O-succinyltransferase
MIVHLSLPNFHSHESNVGPCPPEKHPAWKNGEYTTEPVEGLRGANGLIIIAGSAPLQMQKNYPTPALAESYVDHTLDGLIARTDANNFLYYVDTSRNYNPEPKLQRGRA